MKLITLTAPATADFAADTAAASQAALRRAAWAGVLCQFWVGVLCLAGSVLLPDSGGTTIVCGVVACLSCFAPVAYAVWRRQWVVLFSCLTIFNLAPIWFLYLEVVLAGHDAYLYSRPMFKMEAIFWAATFQFFTNLTYLLLWHRVTVPAIRNFVFLRGINLSATFYSVAALLAFTVPLVAFWVYYDSGEILWIALTAGRADGGSGGGLLVQNPIGTVSSYMLPLNWVWQLTPLLGTIAFVSTERKSSPLPLVAFVAGLLVVFEFFLGGSRSIMMSVVAPVLFFYFYYNWDKGLRFWITAGSLLVVLIGVMELQVRFRSNLLEVLADPDKAAHARGLQSATTFDPTQSHRDNNMYLFCLMVQGYPDHYPYEGFNNFFATLVNPVPRAIWPGKPVLNGANDLSHQAEFVFDGPLLMGTTSLTYSVVGEAYQADGMWAMVVYGVVYGVFLLIFDGLVYYANQRQALSVGVLGVSVFLSFWGYRSFFGLVTFIYPLLLLLLVLYACKALKLV